METFRYLKSSEKIKREIAKLEEEINRNREAYNNVTDTFARAKEMEKADPFRAIELYQSIRGTKYGNFDILGRLIVLYRKTNQIEQEIKHIDLKIDFLYKSARYRAYVLMSKYPENANLIKKCYNEEIPYTAPKGYVVDFFAGIRKLMSRRERLEKKQSSRYLK